MRDSLAEMIHEMLPGAAMCCSCRDYSITACNRFFREILGYASEDEGLYESGILLAHIFPRDLGTFMQYLSDLQQAEDVPPCTVRFRRRDEAHRWISLHGRRIGSGGDDVYLFLCTDVTEETEKQQKFDQQANLLSMMEQMPSGVHSCELLPDGTARLAYISDGLCQLTGFTRQEICEVLESDFERLIAPQDRKRFAAVIRALGEYQHTETVEYRIAHRSGTVFWVSDTIKSVRHPDGRMWAYAVATDIQQRQNRLEDSEKLGDALPCGVAIFDYCEGQIRLGYFNQAMWRFTGLSERQFAERINAGVYGMLHRDDVPQVRSRVAKLAAGANAANCTVRVNTKYGQRFILLVMRVMQRTEPCFRISLMAIDVTRYHKAPEPERHALENISAVTYPGPYVRTFGFFNVFLGGQAVPFHHQKAKELLALLVDQRGGFIGPEEIISRLWEDDPVDKNTLARCRKTFMQLRDDLEAAGVGDIVESDRSLRRVIPEKIGCDLYDFLSGKPQYMGLFKGEYLSNYSWSEYTLASLLGGAYPA